jgi:transcriptional regulator with GAF, ATPase, and Fis domain/serine phosphatase RsbU (regulator of sigma subunit)
MESLQKDIQALGNIGQQITSTRDFETIFLKLHQSVSSLMDAETFGVRIYNPDKNEVDVKYEFDKDVRCEPFSFSMENDNNFSVWCIKNGKEIYINDITKEYKKYVKEIVVIQGEMPQSLIFCPMIMNEKVIGVITVQSYEKKQYTPNHLNIIRTLSSYAAIALENARLYEDMETEVKMRTSEVIKQKTELENSHKNIQLLSKIGQQITSSLSVETIIETVYQNVNELMDASSFWIGIYNEEEQRLNYPLGKEKGKTLPFAFYNLSDDKWLPVWSFKNQKEIMVNDYINEYGNYITNFSPPVPIAGDVPESSIWCPLISKDKKTLGILTVQSFNKHAYSDYQLSIVRSLAIFTSIAIENALLHENVENEVKKRTKEIIKQKEKLEVSYKKIRVLDDIGQQLTSIHDFETIFTKVHQSVNRLMDAECFGIRIYNPDKNEVEVKYEFDKGVRSAPIFFSMENENNFSVWCIKNRKEIFINDNINEYKQYVNEIVVVQGEMAQSLIFCPMIVKDKVIGVLTAQSYKKNKYTSDHLNIIRTLASYAAIAIENARLYENMEAEVKMRTSEVIAQKIQIEKSHKNLSLLSKIGQQITSTLNLETVLNVVYENVNKLMDANAFLIGYYNRETETIDMKLGIEKGEVIPFHGWTMKDKNRLAVWCVDNKKEIFIEDYQKDFNKYIPNIDVPKPVAGKLPESVIYLPLIVEEKIVGIMTVQSFKKCAYTTYDLELARTLASYVAVALNNSEAYKQLDFAKQEVEKLSIVASKSQNTVIICNADLELEWANDSFTHTYKCTLEEFKKVNGSTLPEISGHPGIKKIIDECLSKKEGATYEAKSLIDGKELYFQTSVSPVFDEQGKLLNIVLIDTDITERRKAALEIEQKNKDITDSINYAKKIQQAILPSYEQFNSLFPNSFILFKPKDIVAGDFYWMQEINNMVFIAAADCTGHGVPGAMVSVVCSNALNRAVKEFHLTDTGKILDKVTDLIIETFEKSAADVKDGMDISLLAINKDTEQIQWSGAYNVLWYFQNKELHEITADKQPIGKSDYRKAFTTHKIDYKPSTTFYLFTDGYADQFGGAKGKKFKYKQLEEKLIANCEKELEVQKESLNTAFENWKGDLEQVDDVTIIGIRI